MSPFINYVITKWLKANSLHIIYFPNVTESRFDTGHRTHPMLIDMVCYALIAIGDARLVEYWYISYRLALFLADWALSFPQPWLKLGWKSSWGMDKFLSLLPDLLRCKTRLRLVTTEVPFAKLHEQKEKEDIVLL